MKIPRNKAINYENEITNNAPSRADDEMLFGLLYDIIVF